MLESPDHGFKLGFGCLEFIGHYFFLFLTSKYLLFKIIMKLQSELTAQQYNQLTDEFPLIGNTDHLLLHNYQKIANEFS